MTTCGAVDASAHASTAFRNRLLNACRSSTSSPSMTGNSPFTTTSPPCAARLASHFVGGALGHRAEIDRREHQLLGPGEVEEVGHHFAERFGLLADAPKMRMIGSGQRLEIEQPRVAMNRRQAITEFVGDARGQLADLREALLQAKLLFHFHTGVKSVKRQIAPWGWPGHRDGDTLTPK